MRIGVTMEDDKGLDGNISHHFGQCRYFLVADIEDNEIVNMRVVPNFAQHGGGGCGAVDEALKHGITHMISGGMGAGAQHKFALEDVKVFGYSGRARDAINNLLNNTLGGLEACREHGKHHKQEKRQ